MRSLIVIGVLGIVGLIAGAIINCRDPDNEGVIISVAQDAVRTKSKDPDAVQFGPTWIGQVKGAKVACGTFNGKNSFGAYVGSQRFIAGGDLVLTQERAGPIIEGMWWDSCERFRH